MREIRQSGSEGGGNEQTVSPYPYLSFTYRIFGSACLNTEELRWGSPTATPPFKPLGFAPKRKLKDIFVQPSASFRVNPWLFFCPAPLLLVFLDSPLLRRMTEEEARPIGFYRHISASLHSPPLHSLKLGKMG